MRCDHEKKTVVIAGQFLGHIYINICCYYCSFKKEYKIKTSDLFEKIEELDPDPNIYVNGVLQNE